MDKNWLTYRLKGKKHWFNKKMIDVKNFENKV